MKPLPRPVSALIIVLLLLSAVRPATVFAQSGGVVFRDDSCMFEMPEGVVEGVDVRCGYLTVPERYENPDGPSIELAVAVIQSTSDNPRPDPIFLNQGGPGGSTIDYFTQVMFDSPLRAERDLVLFDQRGTLHSEPALMCPETLEKTIEILDQDIPDDEANRIFREVADACQARLVREGIDLSGFNSLENARDIDSLRQALGYDQINLYGVSYGSLLALHTMRDFPEGLRSVILDAVVPTQVDFNPEGVRTMDRAFTELFNACAADAECNRAYPDLEREFFDLVDRLEKDPVMVDLVDIDTGQPYPALIEGDSLIQLLFQTLYSTELLPLLPKMIHDIRDGRYNVAERILSIITFDRTGAEGMYYSVVCAEDGDFDPDAVNYDGIRPRLLKGERESIQTLLQICQDWSVEQIGDQYDQPVTSTIPTLILNGRFDPITPESYGKQAAETLPNSFVFTFPNTGHGAIGDECADQVMVEFLNDPSAEPSRACLGERTIDFVTGRDVIDFPSIIRALNLHTPSIILLVSMILCVLFLLGAWLVYPLAWIVRMASGKEGHPTNLLGHLSPWTAMFNGLFGLIFLVGLVVAASQMIAENEILILMGISSTYRWVFVFPVLSAILTLLMMAQLVAGLAGRYWSVWRKIYFFLLVGAALICVGLYAYSGALTGVFA